MNKHQFIWAAALMLATTASGARGDEKFGVAALEKSTRPANHVWYDHTGW